LSDTPAVTPLSPEFGAEIAQRIDRPDVFVQVTVYDHSTEAPEADDELEEVTTARPTCRYFAPSQARIDQLRVLLPDDYTYNQPYHYDACTHPLRGSIAGLLPCVATDGDWSECGAAQLEERQLIAVRLHPGTKCVVALEAIRYGFGEPQRRILSWTADQDVEVILDEGVTPPDEVCIEVEFDTFEGSAAELAETALREWQLLTVGEDWVPINTKTASFFVTLA
jgi:hypothetical protein